MYFVYLITLLMVLTVRQFMRGAAFTASKPVVRNLARLGRNVWTQVTWTSLFQSIKDEVDPGDVKGTSLKILKYPSAKLRSPNEEVVQFDDKLKQLAQEMLLVMYAANGIGLAAPQVGINKRLMVFNEKGVSASKNSEIILLNPVILERSEEFDTKEEVFSVYIHRTFFQDKTALRLQFFFMSLLGMLVFSTNLWESGQIEMD